MKELEEKNIQLQKEIDIIRTNYIRALRENEGLKTELNSIKLPAKLDVENLKKFFTECEGSLEKMNEKKE